MSRQDFSCPPYSGAASALHPDLRYGAFTLCGRRFPRLPLVRAVAFVGGPTTPAPALRRGRFGLVRFSLATTRAIAVAFSSSGYLDVSVPGFAPGIRLVDGVWPSGLPHSEIRVRKGYLPLGAAYRSLSRPSSPPRAKASFMCPSLLSLCFLPGAAAECVRAAPPLRQEPVSGRAASCKVSLALVRSRDSLSFR